MAAELIHGPQDITDEWLGLALERVGLKIVSTERIGTGQMSQSHRVTFTSTGAGEESVVVKLASDDPASRATGVGMGAYSREISFYRELARARRRAGSTAATSRSTTRPRAGSR